MSIGGVNTTFKIPVNDQGEVVYKKHATNYQEVDIAKMDSAQLYALCQELYAVGEAAFANHLTTVFNALHSPPPVDPDSLDSEQFFSEFNKAFQNLDVDMTAVLRLLFEVGQKVRETSMKSRIDELQSQKTNLLASAQETVNAAWATFAQEMSSASISMAGAIGSLGMNSGLAGKLKDAAKAQKKMDKLKELFKEKFSGVDQTQKKLKNEQTRIKAELKAFEGLDGKKLKELVATKEQDLGSLETTKNKLDQEIKDLEVQAEKAKSDINAIKKDNGEDREGWLPVKQGKLDFLNAQLKQKMAEHSNINTEINTKITEIKDVQAKIQAEKAELIAMHEKHEAEVINEVKQEKQAEIDKLDAAIADLKAKQETKLEVVKDKLGIESKITEEIKLKQEKRDAIQSDLSKIGTEKQGDIKDPALKAQLETIRTEYQALKKDPFSSTEVLKNESGEILRGWGKETVAESRIEQLIKDEKAAQNMIDGFDQSKAQLNSEFDRQCKPLQKIIDKGEKFRSDSYVWSQAIQQIFGGLAGMVRGGVGTIVAQHQSQGQIDEAAAKEAATYLERASEMVQNLKQFLESLVATLQKYFQSYTDASKTFRANMG